MLKDPPFSRLDLVSCRNFLIYLEPDIQKVVLNTFHYSLKPAGYLFLGQSESHSVKNELFETIDAKSCIYRKKESRKAFGEFLTRNRTADLQRHSSGIIIPAKKKISLKEFAEGKALTEFMHPFILIDKKGEIYYSLGKCDKYFRFHVGEPDQNIVNLSREGLKIPLSNALRQINNDNKPFSYNNIKVKVHDGFEIVNLDLAPVTKPSFNHLIVVNILPVHTKHNREEGTDISAASEVYIRQMEQELQDTRDHLNNVIEELEASNEELKSLNEEARSTNEELQSANEELETSGEEMHSLNEELETSNKELQSKVEEISNINNDLNNFLQSTPIGTLFLDRNLKIRRFSPHIRDIVNLVESDIGRSIGDFEISFPESQVVNDVRQVLNTLKSMEKDISRGNNQHYWMRILPYRTLEDKIDGVVITFTDFTEKYRVQRLFEESKKWKKYKQLYHHMDHGFALFSPIRNNSDEIIDYRLMEANQAFANIMMRNPDNLEDRKMTKLFKASDFSDSFMQVGHKVIEGQTYNEERFFKNINKYLRILYFAHEEDIVAVLVQDITRERTEQIARFHLASIVESTDDAVFTESPEGKILTWNRGAVKLYGYQDKEAIGLSIAELYFYPDDVGDAAVMEKAREGDNLKNHETVHKHKDGSMIPVSITTSPIRDDEGKVVAISSIVKDITYLKEREEELVRTREATEQAASLKSMFLANMSHEIRTPLNSILGFGDMLRREVTDEKPVKYVENINNSSRQLLYLINDIVDVSRLDAGELPIHNSSISLHALMNLIKDQFEGYASKNRSINIDFRLKLPDDKEDLYVVTDENRLQQILKNLLSNAFKYTNEGCIEFGYEVRNSNLLFYVSDTGVGISQDNHEKVFDRFQQAENGSNNKGKVIRGTGLGLAIARGLTERLGGKMWLSSEEGNGSVFYFTIPYIEGERAENNGSHVKEGVVHIPQLEGKKILIAEDDPYSLEMLKIMLQDTKITMLVARDGEEVMDIFKKEFVDILLLDIRMPKKDGYELAREIRSSYPEIPIIAQSAFAMPEQIRKSLEMGFNKHLVKPLRREDLYHTLETYLK